MTLEMHKTVTLAVRRLDEVSLADVGSVGGKGGNLGELLKARLPVPPGFVVTSEAYLEAIERSGARAELQNLMAAAHPDDSASLTDTADLSRRAVLRTCERQFHLRSPTRSAGSTAIWVMMSGWPSGHREQARTGPTRRSRA